MLKRSVLVTIALFALLLDPSFAHAKRSKGSPNRSPASLNGCQISRKGTKIRCPHGMFIRADVVQRKIAGEKSGRKSSSSKKKRSSRN